MVSISFLNSLLKSNKTYDHLLIIGKILLLLLMAVYLFGNVNPYYQTIDGYTYGTVAIHISQGDFFLTNDLLEETGRIEFVPGDWGLNLEKTKAYPVGDQGLNFLSAFFYLLGGNYGLFYLGPIFGISSLVIIERFTTKFFDKYTGFLTLLFLSTNHILYRNFLNLQTEGLFLTLFIIGCYFLFSFYKNKNISIFYSSVFFVLSTLTRINGIMYFPVEFFLIGIFLLFPMMKKIKIIDIKEIKLNNNIKNNLKYIIFAIIPWILFLIFWIIFNMTLSGSIFEDPRNQMNFGEDRTFSSLFELEKKNFINLERYSKYLLPYQFPAMYNSTGNLFDEILFPEWLGFFGIISLIIMCCIAIFFKIKPLEIITFTLFIISTIWFYSTMTTDDRGELGVPGRYMIPAFTLYYIVISYLIVKLFNSNLKYQFLKNYKIQKIIIFSILLLFFSTSLFFIPPSQAIINNSFELKNPYILNQNHPPPSEGLSSNDVILSDKTTIALEYEVIIFNIHRNELGLMSIESIDLLQQILENNYRVFIFKQETLKDEKNILKDLILNHNFSLNDFSSSFCQLKLIDKEKSPITDSVCLQNP